MLPCCSISLKLHLGKVNSIDISAIAYPILEQVCHNYPVFHLMHDKWRTTQGSYPSLYYLCKDAAKLLKLLD